MTEAEACTLKHSAITREFLWCGWKLRNSTFFYDSWRKFHGGKYWTESSTEEAKTDMTYQLKLYDANVIGLQLVSGGNVEKKS